MKKLLLFLMLCTVLFSCSPGEKRFNWGFCHEKVDSLKHRITGRSLKFGFTPKKDNSLYDYIAFLEHKNDSLQKIATRWEYGREFAINEQIDYEDRMGGNATSWDTYLSATELKFDPNLLDSKKIEMSEKSPWRLGYTEIDHLINAMTSSPGYLGSLDPTFEADRCNYLYSVMMVNAMNELVSIRAVRELRGKYENLSRVESDNLRYYYEGLIYKSIYEKLYTLYNEHPTLEILIPELLQPLY